MSAQPTSSGSAQPAFSLTPQPLGQAQAAAPFTLAPQPLGSAQQPAFSLAPQPMQFQAQPLQFQAQPLQFQPQPIGGATAQPAFSLAPQPIAQAAPAAAAPAPAAAAPAAASGNPEDKPLPESQTIDGHTITADDIRKAAAAAQPPAIPGNPPDPCPKVAVGLPVVDDASAFEQCMGWAFFMELATDFVVDVDIKLANMQAYVNVDRHLLFSKEAHAIKGAALNLHLPGLSDVTKKAEHVGKQLYHHYHDGRTLSDLDDHLAARQIFIDHCRVEVARFREVMPQYQLKADAEEAGEGEEDYGDDGEGEPNFHD